MEKPSSATGVIGMSIDTNLQASLAHLNIRAPSHPSISPIGISKQPLLDHNAVFISEAIFDNDSRHGTPKTSIPHSFDYSNRASDMDMPSGEPSHVTTKLNTVCDYSLADLEIMVPAYHNYDYLTPAEVIYTTRVEIGPNAIIFSKMLDFSFQDMTGKWQAYREIIDSNHSQMTDTSLEESGEYSGISFSLFARDLKGKKPVYGNLIEDFDTISPTCAEKAEEAPQQETWIQKSSSATPTSSICTCDLRDVKLALELYLQSIKKQPQRLKHRLRRSSSMTKVLSSSTVCSELARKLSELYLKVEELHCLVTTERVVSSVTMTEIHRLMDKALIPVSQLVSALCGEIVGITVTNEGWSKRRRRIKQRMKEDWKPRMRALVGRVDQADAWVQLVVIRIARVRWEW
jgi:hypothetical protein